VLTSDVEGSVAFYEKLFGWRAEELRATAATKCSARREMVAG
jgi:predicted enzyme related to lactoylglutathione lyase